MDQGRHDFVGFRLGGGRHYQRHGRWVNPGADLFGLGEGVGQQRHLGIFAQLPELFLVGLVATALYDVAG